MPITKRLKNTYFSTHEIYVRCRCLATGAANSKGIEEKETLAEEPDVTRRRLSVKLSWASKKTSWTFDLIIYNIDWKALIWASMLVLIFYTYYIQQLNGHWKRGRTVAKKGDINTVPQLKMACSPRSSFGPSSLGAPGGPWTPPSPFPAALPCGGPVARLAAQIRQNID